MEERIITFFSTVEHEVQGLSYGTITGTVIIQDGLPLIKTLNLVLSKRKRYKIGPEIDNKEEE